MRGRRSSSTSYAGTLRSPGAAGVFNQSFMSRKTHVFQDLLGTSALVLSTSKSSMHKCVPAGFTRRSIRRTCRSGSRTWRGAVMTPPPADEQHRGRTTSANTTPDINTAGNNTGKTHDVISAPTSVRPGNHPHSTEHHPQHGAPPSEACDPNSEPDATRHGTRTREEHNRQQASTKHTHALLNSPPPSWSSRRAPSSCGGCRASGCR